MFNPKIHNAMKVLRMIAAAAIAALTVSLTASAQDVKKKPVDREVTYSVSIHCANCKKKLDANLPHVKGVKDLKVDLAAKTVWFRYSPDKVTKEQLAQAIEKQGYSALEIVPAAEK